MNSIKQKYNIVCARYNEDIRWLLPFRHITTIYNKGNYSEILNKFETIILNNVGRESHTYLYHIVQNYDNLASKTIFFQGKINDHKILDLEDYFKDDDFTANLDNFPIDKLKDRIIHYGKYKQQYNNGNMKISYYTPYDWITKVIGLNIDNENKISKIVWGANFSISKELIHKKPKIFYENILKHIENDINPEEGHFLERTWYMIFHYNYISKPKIAYMYIDKYNHNINNNILKKFGNSYEEIHVWCELDKNLNLGKYEDIYYTSNNLKYIDICPIIQDNSFRINVKANNDAHILIEFTDYEEKYEIVLGGWNNTKSIIRDYYNNVIIASVDKKILDKNNFIQCDIKLTGDNKLIVSVNNEILLNYNHTFKNNCIRNIKIKDYIYSSIYWDYKSNDMNNMNDSKIKYFLSNENIKRFYTNNYLDKYVENINILDIIA
jgi:hypothetical protein